MKKKYTKNMTYFGFQKIPNNKKTSMISDVFHSVALKYDLMNDIMSFGIHRIWKNILINNSNVYYGHTVLDLAGGTGDLSIKFSQLVGEKGIVILADSNNSMLRIGQKKLRNLGIINNVLYVQTDAESLPFADNTFNCVAVSFGLRNFTNQKKALLSIHRVLKPAGKILILEFSMPESNIINTLYNFYSFYIIPKIGKYVAKDSNSYRYLIESIRMHPNPEIVKSMMLKTGFKNVKYYNISFGIVTLFYAYK